MFNARSTFSLGLKNQKGQIAIFVALIFQVLFLFFAMVINVGLLVHHKINLQNSVDLAAYYGAMKQAQTMNAIAHTNYQIRQSWKLLAWRYRMIGSAGDFTEHPFKKTTVPPQIVGGDADDIGTSNPKFYEAPAFCTSYVPFKPMPPGENTCKDMANFSGVSFFTVPSVIIDLPSISGKVAALTQAYLSAAQNRCQWTGPFNYKMLGQFVVGFIQDQKSRMELISVLSQSISPADPKADFYDLDGKSVTEGIRNTLSNNLTSANNATLQFETYNSLGHDSCNRTGVAAGNPAKWLVPIRVQPAFSYVDADCNGGLRPVGRELNAANIPKYTIGSPNLLQTEIDKLSKYIGVQSVFTSTYNYSVGVEKNPWCVAYMGVKATTSPKIPFSPFGAVTLNARAFYKPFGGRMGPWYYKNYPASSSQGSMGSANDKVDINYPPRATGSMTTIGSATDPTRAANYSRFIGDQFGLKSKRVLGQYGAAIYKLDEDWAKKSLQYNASNAADYGDGAPNFNHWNHIPFDFYHRGKSQDLLSWNGDKDEPSRFRTIELAAILPDPFDLAYYSIEPDFYHNYYEKIQNGLLAGSGATYYNDNREFLGDIGTHKGSTNGANWDKFSVKDQYAVVNRDLASGFLKGIQFDIDTKLTYISKNWMDVLTSWAPLSLKDYSLDSTRFGKCQVFPSGVQADGNGDAIVPTSGNCVAGGSSGYSVKMVHPEFFTKTLELGGSGVSGQILNPPADF